MKETELNIPVNLIASQVLIHNTIDKTNSGLQFF